MLQAWSEGIGSCWLLSVQRDPLRQLLGIPPGWDIDSVIALGYPSEKPRIEPAVGSIRYWKDQQGTLHVPKRELRSILHINRWNPEKI